MQLHVFDDIDSLAEAAAAYIVRRIKDHKESKPFVLGLPTGNTPTPVYKKLIEYYKKNLISFKNVITFNMDEYMGMKKDNKESFNYYMHSNFFDHIDIPKENINIPYSECYDTKNNKYCIEYENKIAKHGPIDLFLCGVGKNGHIAFNEPFSSCYSTTRIVTLDIDPKEPPFCNMNPVPTKAMTVGIKTILDAKSLLVLATGASKKEAIAAAIDGPFTHKWPITCTQLHPDVVYMVDKDAASKIEQKSLNFLLKSSKDSLKEIEKFS